MESNCTLVLPTLNELAGLQIILPQIDRKIFQEIIVVDGGSTDGTIELSQKEGLRVIRQPGKGLPDALEAAFLNVRSDSFVVFTPDGNSLPELLPDVVSKLNEGNDLVVVSRYLAGAHSDDDDALTSFGNRFFVFLVNFLFRTSFTDVLVAYRGYSRRAVQRTGLMSQSQENWMRKNFFYMNGWELGSTIRAKRAGLKFTEIPGDEPKRIGGIRKLSILKNGFGSLFQIILDFFTYWPSRSHQPIHAEKNPETQNIS